MDRRSFLAIGLTGAASVTVGATGALGVSTILEQRANGAVGRSIVPFYGVHQSGISTPLQSHGNLVAFNLKPDARQQEVQALLRLWSTDAALLQSGRPAMADSAPELAITPASLTVTIGIAHSAFVRADVASRWPFAATEIPAYSIDALQPDWTGGDLVLQICANDAMSVAHATRELVKDAKPFASVAWSQSGSMPGVDVNPGETPRNHMGFKDGTGNPLPGTRVFEQTVWNNGATQPWFAGGSALVIRRIRMDLDRWETLTPQQMEAAFGRHLTSGAPLGATNEFQRVDLDGRDTRGLPLIPINAHVRRATLKKDLYRRPFNYADGPSEMGLLFVAYCADIQQYLDIQASLAEYDAINTWTTPIGSAMFAVPPGAPEPGAWVGESLFS